MATELERELASHLKEMVGLALGYGECLDFVRMVVSEHCDDEL